MRGLGHFLRNMTFERQNESFIKRRKRLSEILPVYDSVVRKPVEIASPIVVVDVEDPYDIAVAPERIGRRFAEDDPVSGIETHFEMLA